MSFDKFPFELREIARSVPVMHYDVKTTWASLMQSHMPMDHMSEHMTRKAADQITHEFVKHVMRGMRIERRESAEGVTHAFEAVALSYHELMELLYKAYAAGQSDGMRRGAAVVPCN